MLRWSRRLCTRGASRGNRLSVLPASTAILPFTGGNLSFGFARRSWFDDNDNDVVGPVDVFLGGIVGIYFFLILSTGHGAYLTGRSAAQLMIRLTTISFIVIIVDHHSHQNHHNHRLHCDLYLFIIVFWVGSLNSDSFAELWKTTATMEARQRTIFRTPLSQTSVRGFKRYYPTRQPPKFFWRCSITLSTLSNLFWPEFQ